MRRRAPSLVVGALVWIGACSASSKEGVTVSVEVESPGQRRFETASGHVDLTRAWLNTGSVELFGCVSTWLELFALHDARAHVVGSPTLLGTPLVVPLAADARPREKMGELHPPAGAYCRVRQTVMAADADAPGSPPDGTMLGKSVVLEGTFTEGRSEPRPFHFSSTASFDVETTFEATALSIDSTEARRTATIVLELEGTAWFEGVDFAGDGTAATTRILENLRRSLGARVE